MLQCKNNLSYSHVLEFFLVILSVCFLIVVNASIVIVTWGSGAETHDSPLAGS